MSKLASKQQAKKSEEKKTETDPKKGKEELRKMLLDKFAKKYDPKTVPKQLIEKKVDEFLGSMTLNEANLKKLDANILAASTNAQANEKNEDNSSEMSGASDEEEVKKPKQLLDTKARFLKEASAEERPKTGQDEWAAIIKFNNNLFQEELKQEQRKKAQKTKFIKTELEKQVKEKQGIKSREKDEERAYIDYEKKRLEQLNDIEKRKMGDKKIQVETEKAIRDKQRKDDLIRKKKEEREEKKKDRELIERMQKELELEKKFSIEKKELEKETIKKMMEESLRLKEQQKEMEKKEKEDDIKMQEAQRKILDMQEADRIADLMQKDARNKKLLESGLRAKTVKGGPRQDEVNIKEQERLMTAQKMEEEKISLKRKKEKQLEVRATLEKQVQEKKMRAEKEKRESQQQAEMWKKDLELHTVQEQSNSQKLKDVNKKHQDYLMKQMEIAKKGKSTGIMNEREYMLNKQLLEQAIQNSGKENETEAPKK